MVHATPDPRSYSSEDTETLSRPPQTSQAAVERAAYIESLLADWPAPTPKQERTIGSLLGNGGLTVDQYRHWEMVRYLDSQHPGRHGSFKAETAA